ncbi:TRAP transporter small permease [Stappia sp. P2PMeth1]|uniref:TRAP transporter small permease n=1 Tax=Stappia sp. P2PMeth1 TaxID=2003586 RepID=UPI00164503AD|nr:TRAP transporter small permease [Stappia sp. P2PMeth1]
MSHIIIRVGAMLRWILRQGLALMLLAIIVLVSFQVVARYVTHGATHQLAEICRLLMIWMVFCGAALLVSMRDLILIDVVQHRMSPRARGALGLGTDALTALLLVFLSHYAWQLIQMASGKIAPATGLSYRWFYLPPIVFGALGLFFIIERLFTRRLVSPAASLPPSSPEEIRP